MKRRLICLFLIFVFGLVGCAAENDAEKSNGDAEDIELTGNVFLDAEVMTPPIKVGNKVTHFGYIKLSKEDALAASQDDFSKFVNERVAESDCAWWSIIFFDGTGIQFPGCEIGAPQYGKIVSDGTLTELIGIITLSEDGVYSYEELSD